MTRPRIYVFTLVKNNWVNLHLYSICQILIAFFFLSRERKKGSKSGLRGKDADGHRKVLPARFHSLSLVPSSMIGKVLSENSSRKCKYRMCARNVITNNLSGKDVILFFSPQFAILRSFVSQLRPSVHFAQVDMGKNACARRFCKPALPRLRILTNHRLTTQLIDPCLAPKIRSLPTAFSISRLCPASVLLNA